MENPRELRGFFRLAMVFRLNNKEPRRSGVSFHVMRLSLNPVTFAGITAVAAFAVGKRFFAAAFAVKFFLARFAVAIVLARRATEFFARLGFRLAGDFWLQPGDAVFFDFPLQVTGDGGEIGRASCRERV